MRNKRKKINLNHLFVREKNTSGLTLIETLVAISIFLIFFSSVMFLVQRNISAPLDVRDRTVALYLAQESIEHILNIKDTNILNGEDWSNNLDHCSSIHGCNVDVNEKLPRHSIFRGNARPRMCIDEESYRYIPRPNCRVEGVTDSGFSRVIFIEEKNDDEAIINVTISWWRSGEKELKLTRHIFKWKEE